MGNTISLYQLYKYKTNTPQTNTPQTTILYKEYDNYTKPKQIIQLNGKCIPFNKHDIKTKK